MRSTVASRLRWVVPFGAVLALCVWLAGGASEALAANACSGTLHGRIAGPLDVFAGQTCKLVPGTVVAGRTSVEGSLIAEHVTFAGSVFATNAAAISIDNSSVDRSLHLAHGRGPINLRGDTIIGLTTFLDNAGAINIFGGHFGSLSCLISVSIPHFHNVRAALAAIARCVHSAPSPVPVAPPTEPLVPVTPQPALPSGIPCPPIGPGIMHPDSPGICLTTGPVSQ